MKKNCLLFVFILLPFLLLASCKKELNEIYLDELSVDNLLQDWGEPQINTNVIFGPLKINNVVYERGIGTHSISRFLLKLDGDAEYITGYVGADDQNEFFSKMEFKVIGDQKELWSSGVMYKGVSAKKFKVNLKNIQKVLLLVCEAGDGIMYDHADWVNTKIITAGKVEPLPVTPKRIEKEKYILTPPISESPRINSPKVFGVRPGNQFYYTIAATGLRPMSFSANNLPKGLVLDEKTGIISGEIHTPGEYNIEIEASNVIGSILEEVVVHVGNEVCLTPPLGWNSWNRWGAAVTQENVKEAADYMSENLINHGWSYIGIDDGWQATDRSENGVLLGNERFPDMKGLGEYIHSKGLRFGIYSSPGETTCAGYVGSYGYDLIDAKTWAEWGVDMLKYDNCSYDKLVGTSTEENMQKPYVIMREALDQVDRDIAYCVGFGAPNVWNWGRLAGGNYWRTTRDITDEWNVVLAIGSFQDVCAHVTKPGKFNDPDMLVVGNLGQGWGADPHESYLTPDEQYTHVSLWCLLSSPLLIGCDMSAMDDFTLSLLTNDEVLSVNQDPLVKPAKKYIVENGQIWTKELNNGDLAIGLFNIDPYEILWDQSLAKDIQLKNYQLSISLDELGLDGEYIIRDLWRQQDVGLVNNKLSAAVPYHGVKLYKLSLKNKE